MHTHTHTHTRTHIHTRSPRLAGMTAGNGATVNTCGKYTIATKAFGSMASMPVGVNHAAFASDSTRIFVVGGRCVALLVRCLIGASESVDV
jgi:hypothetical protein